MWNRWALSVPFHGTRLWPRASPSVDSAGRLAVEGLGEVHRVLRPVETLIMTPKASRTQPQDGGDPRPIFSPLSTRRFPPELMAMTRSPNGPAARGWIVSVVGAPAASAGGSHLGRVPSAWARRGRGHRGGRRGRGAGGVIGALVVVVAAGRRSRRGPPGGRSHGAAAGPAPASSFLAGSGRTSRTARRSRTRRPRSGCRPSGRRCCSSRLPNPPMPRNPGIPARPHAGEPRAGPEARRGGKGRPVPAAGPPRVRRPPGPEAPGARPGEPGTIGTDSPSPSPLAARRRTRRRACGT